MLKKISKPDGVKKLQRIDVRHVEFRISEPVTSKGITNLINDLKQALASSSYCEIVLISHK